MEREIFKFNHCETDAILLNLITLKIVKYNLSSHCTLNAGGALGFEIDGAHNYPYYIVKPCLIFKFQNSTESL